MSERFGRLLLAFALCAQPVIAATNAGDPKGRAPLPGLTPPIAVPGVTQPLSLPAPLVPALPSSDPVAPLAVPGAAVPEGLIPAPQDAAVPPAAPAAYAVVPPAYARLVELTRGALPAAAFDGAGGDGKAPPSGPSEPAVPDGDAVSAPPPSQPDPPFYGRQRPPSDRSKPKKYQPTPADTEAARREFLEIAARGEEIFNAPTWFEKREFPEFKNAVFTVAFLDEALTDIANGQEAEIPAELDPKDGVVANLLLRRAEAYAVYRYEVARIEAEVHRPPYTETRAKNNARMRIERWHSLGFVTPSLERDPGTLPEEYRGLAATYQQMRDIAAGRMKATQGEVNALAEVYEQALRRTLLLRKARALDLIVASTRGKATPAEAKAIYDKSVREAKDQAGDEGLRHLEAWILASDTGSILPAPNVGKQIRPTCTMHMLASLLAAMGIRRDLTELIKEARLILNDPYVGMTTAFTLAQQRKLFRYYGKLSEVKANLFESLIIHRRNLKISIEIGDPIYKHSLLLQGFYEIDGRTFVALRDSTSYFATRMSLEDFARVLTADNALLFLEVHADPRAE